MQIEVSKVSVTEAGEQFGGKLLNVTMNLKCWDDKDDKEVDIPIIDQNFSEKYKIVDGKTETNQISDMMDKLKLKMSYEIDKYNREKLLFDNSLLDTAVSSAKTALEG